MIYRFHIKGLHEIALDCKTTFRSATTVKRCRKTVRDDDNSDIMCEKCSMWFHGAGVSLTVDEVVWLGNKKTVSGYVIYVSLALSSSPKLR